MTIDQVRSKYFFDFCEYRSVEIPRPDIKSVIGDRIYHTPVIQQCSIVNGYKIGSCTVRHFSLIGDKGPLIPMLNHLIGPYLRVPHPCQFQQINKKWAPNNFSRITRHLAINPE